MPDRLHRWARVGFLALVAVLPLHTVFFRAEIAWKPWLILLLVVVGLDLWIARGIPFPRKAVIGVGVFLVAALVSWPGSGAGLGFWRLWLALVAGGLLLLATGLHAVRMDEVLRTIFWSGAAVGLSAVVLALVTNGVFGEEAVSGINDLVLINRVNKPAYLGSGFVALTNWHQDPGYSALWTNVWLVLAVFAWSRRIVKAPAWVGPLVVGGLVAATLLTYSRTGWLGLVVAFAVLLAAHWRRARDSVADLAKLLFLGGIIGVALLGVQLAVDPPGIGGDISTAFEFRFAYILELGAIDVGEGGVVDPDLVVPDNRLDVWSEYWARFLENPIRGIGLGTGWSEPGLQEPHNMWLELAGETGVVGLTGFLVMLGMLGRAGDEIAASVLAVVFIAGLTQTVLFEPVLWFGLGLWVAANQRSRGELIGNIAIATQADPLAARYQ